MVGPTQTNLQLLDARLFKHAWSLCGDQTLKVNKIKSLQCLLMYEIVLKLWTTFFLI